MYAQWRWSSVSYEPDKLNERVLKRRTKSSRWSASRRVLFYYWAFVLCHGSATATLVIRKFDFSLNFEFFFVLSFFFSRKQPRATSWCMFFKWRRMTAGEKVRRDRGRKLKSLARNGECLWLNKRQFSRWGYNRGKCKNGVSSKSHFTYTSCKKARKKPWIKSRV